MRSKFRFVDESPLIKFRKLTRRMANRNIQRKSQRMEIIKKIKWKEINMKRVMIEDQEVS
jgi:hypothetical protein